MKRKMYPISKGILMLLLAAGTQKASAQVGIGTASPDTSAQLHIESTNKGVLMPRVTGTGLIATPANGLLVYQTGGTPGFYYNSGTAITPVWTRISDAATAAPTANYGFATNASSIIAVILGGTNIPLPNTQKLNGVTVDGSNTTFTVTNAGTYRIEYNINLTAGLLVYSRLLINGSADVSSTLNPPISLSSYRANTILTLTAGTTISLQLYGILAAATLQSGQGASLMIQKL